MLTTGVATAMLIVTSLITAGGGYWLNTVESGHLKRVTEDDNSNSQNNSTKILKIQRKSAEFSGKNTNQGNQGHTLVAWLQPTSQAAFQPPGFPSLGL